VCGVSFGAGRVYVGGGYAVRDVNPQTDRLTTPAGTGAVGPPGDGGPAVRAGLDLACGVAADPQGNLVIADSGNRRIRMVTP
jgi:hypothetical protein